MGALHGVNSLTKGSLHIPPAPGHVCSTVAEVPVGEGRMHSKVLSLIHSIPSICNFMALSVKPNLENPSWSLPAALVGSTGVLITFSAEPKTKGQVSFSSTHYTAPNSPLEEKATGAPK